MSTYLSEAGRSDSEMTDWDQNLEIQALPGQHSITLCSGKIFSLPGLWVALTVLRTHVVTFHFFRELELPPHCPQDLPSSSDDQIRECSGHLFTMTEHFHRLYVCFKSPFTLYVTYPTYHPSCVISCYAARTGNNDRKQCVYVPHRPDTVFTNTAGPRLVEFLNGESGHRADCMVFSNLAC